jgi:hypothetical protein
VYFFSNPEKKDAIEGINDAIRNVGFADTLEKHRASLLHEKIKQEIQNHCLVDENGFTIANKTTTSGPSTAKARCGGLVFSAGFGLDNKTPHVGASVVLNVSSEAYSTLSLGVHIQGLQYRRMLNFDGYRVLSRKQGKIEKELITFIAETDDWKWMFAASHSNGKFDGRFPQDGFFKDAAGISTLQQKNKLLCSYAPCHIYQHTTIGDAQGVPIDKVVDAIIEDLKYATQLLNDPSYVAPFLAWSQKT